MSYGFLAVNGDDEVVIDDAKPVMVVRSTGTLTKNRTFAGLEQYSGPVSNLFTGSQLITFKLPVGGRIWISSGVSFGGSSDLGSITSTEATLDYTVFEPRNLQAAPTGYGAAVYDSSSNIMWDSASVTCRVVDGGNIDKSLMASSDPYRLTVNTTANSVFTNLGAVEIAFFNPDYQYAMSAYRVSPTQWYLEKAHKGDTSPVGGTARFDIDFNYLFAQVT